MLEYAPRLMSAAGRHDGLYWEGAAEPLVPAAFAQAAWEGAQKATRQTLPRILFPGSRWAGPACAGGSAQLHRQEQADRRLRPGRLAGRIWRDGDSHVHRESGWHRLPERYCAGSGQDRRRRSPASTPTIPGLAWIRPTRPGYSQHRPQIPRLRYGHAVGPGVCYVQAGCEARQGALDANAQMETEPRAGTRVAPASRRIRSAGYAVPFETAGTFSARASARAAAKRNAAGGAWARHANDHHFHDRRVPEKLGSPVRAVGGRCPGAFAASASGGASSAIGIHSPAIGGSCAARASARACPST